MPVCTGNSWNETADKLAKEAAKTWVKQNTIPSLTAGS